LYNDPSTGCSALRDVSVCARPCQYGDKEDDDDQNRDHGIRKFRAARNNITARQMRMSIAAAVRARLAVRSA
jgi:hypothetical protein